MHLILNVSDISCLLGTYIIPKFLFILSLSYGNQSIDMLCKSVDWFLVSTNCKVAWKEVLSTFWYYLELRKRKLNEPTCPTWYDLYYLNNAKNTHERVLLLVKLQVSNEECYEYHSSMGTCTFTKSNAPTLVFLTIFQIIQMIPNCTKHYISFETHQISNNWEI